MAQMIGLNFPSNHLAFLFKAEMAVDLSKTNKEECVENELKQITTYRFETLTSQGSSPDLATHPRAVHS